jgi:outer membrane protein assembly factor BamB
MNHVLLQSENSITQLDADSGRVLWTFDLSPFQGLHVYASQWSANRVSIGLRNQLENWTRYIVLDAMSGRQLWEKTVDSYYASFSPTDEQGFIFASPGSLNLLDPDTGRVRWTIDPTPYTKDLSSPMFNVIAVQNGKIHFQVFDNPPSRYPSLRLLTLSEADGSFLWQKAYFAASRLAGTNDDFIFVSKTNPSGPATAEDTFLEALVK